MKELKIKWSIIGLLTLCCVVVSLFTACERKTTPLAIDTQQTDSIKSDMSPEEAVKTNLQLQKDMVNQDLVDSIYKTMPTDILIIISLQHPDMWMNEIVNEYINNKDYYDRLTKDNKQVKNYRLNNPDTLPTKSKTQTQLDNSLAEPITNL